MGPGLPFSVLSPVQQAQMSTIVYGNNELMINWEYRGQPNEAEGVRSNIRFQPTECDADGLPSSSRLKINSASGTLIRCMRTAPEGYLIGREFDEDGLAGIMMHAARPDILDYGPPENWTSFTPMEHSSYRYTLSTLPQLSHRDLLRYVSSQQTSTDSIDKLPPDFLERVRTKFAKLREHYKNYRPPN